MLRDEKNDVPFQAQFLKSVVSGNERAGAEDWPEIAIGGRSNVGKSTLLNALCSSRSLARVSKTPGRTRALNYFSITSERFYLVDLPGYGFAKGSKADSAQWRKATDLYVSSHPNLTGIISLIDGQIGPTALDREFIEWMQDTDKQHLIVLTKSDKGSQSERSKALKAARELASETPVVAVSSVSMRGVSELREIIRAWVGGSSA